MTADTEALEAAYRLLDVQPGATEDEVRQAYHRMKALYSEGSLATYDLLTEEERAGKLSEIERAYLSLTVALRGAAQERQSPLPGTLDAGAPADPVPVEDVGAYLKRRREELGLPLKEVATRTRIRSAHLENIEDQRYDLLPAPVYLRGFIIEYARSLKLPDPEGLATLYMDRYQESRTE